MSGQHVALIVEDEPEMAAEIADLLRSFGHDHIHVETKSAAIEALDAGGFCYVLLDLKIKTDEKSIKPRVEAGMWTPRKTSPLSPVSDSLREMAISLREMAMGERNEGSTWVFRS